MGLMKARQLMLLRSNLREALITLKLEVLQVLVNRMVDAWAYWGFLFRNDGLWIVLSVKYVWTDILSAWDSAKLALQSY